MKQKKIIGEIASAVLTWREESLKLGLSKANIDQISSAFEHKELEISKSFLS